MLSTKSPWGVNCSFQKLATLHMALVLSSLLSADWRQIFGFEKKKIKF